MTDLKLASLTTSFVWNLNILPAAYKWNCLTRTIEHILVLAVGEHYKFVLLLLLLDNYWLYYHYFLTCHASVGLEITPAGWRAELLRFVVLRAVADFTLGSEPADSGRWERDGWLNHHTPYCYVPPTWLRTLHCYSNVLHFSSIHFQMAKQHEDGLLQFNIC